MAEIMQGGEMFKLVGTTVYTDRTGNEERCPTYIRVPSCSDTERVIIAKAGNAFLQIGSVGFRDPDDRYKIDTHKTYIQIPPDQINKKTGNTDGETELYKDIAALLAKKLKQYIDNGGSKLWQE